MGEAGLSITEIGPDGAERTVAEVLLDGSYIFNLSSTTSREDLERNLDLAMQIFRICKTEPYKAIGSMPPEDTILIDGDYTDKKIILSNYFKEYYEKNFKKKDPLENPLNFQGIPDPKELEELMESSNIPEDFRERLRKFNRTQRRIESEHPELSPSEISKMAGEEEESQQRKITKEVKKRFGIQRDPELEGLRQSIVVEDRPDVSFEDIAGQDSAVQEAKNLARILARRDEIEKMYGPKLVPRGILFYGPPGGGKTMIAKALANEANAGFVMVRATDLASKWYGDSEKFAKGIFEIAREQADERGHCILYIDEVDSILPPRTSGNTHEVTQRVVSTFLQEIDGLTTEAGQITIVASTNIPENVDPAFLSRMTSWIEVPLPAADGRAKILDTHFQKRAKEVGRDSFLDSSVDLNEIAQHIEGLSGRDIADLVQIVLLKKALNSLDHEYAPVTTADIFQALKDSTKSREMQKEIRKNAQRIGFRHQNRED